MGAGGRSGRRGSSASYAVVRRRDRRSGPSRNRMKGALAAATVAAWLLFTAILRAEPIRILLAAGQGRGLAGEVALRYADRDAEHVRDVFTSIGGVRPENTIVVVGATATQIVGALDRAQAIARAHRPD